MQTRACGKRAVSLLFVLSFLAFIVSCPDPGLPKTVVLGAQSGTIVSGAAGSATFSVSTANVAAGTAGSFAWYSSAAGTSSAPAPAGIAASVSALSGDAATVTMAASSAAIAGSYYFSLSEGGATSAVATLVVSAAPTPVAFTGLSANGSSGSVTTTTLTLTFDANPTTLAASDISLTGATKGALSGTGTTRSLAISDITVADGDDLTLTIANPAGYAISPSTRTVAANFFSLNLALVSVPGGTFQRDATASNTSTVSAFRIGKFEVTRAQFLAIMGSDPSDTAHSSGSADPVQMVNWYQAIAFCNKLSIAEGLTPVYSVTVSGVPVNFATLTYASIPTTFNSNWDAPTANWSANGYRLPTEMEWMWAAMGADMANPGAVNTSGYAKAFAGSTGVNGIGDCAVYGQPSSTGVTSPAGSKSANELAIFDMSGNVWEVCWDGVNTSSPYPAYRITGAVTNYRGETSGNRIIRGGGWATNTTNCSVAARNFATYESYNQRGFRVARN